MTPRVYWNNGALIKECFARLGEWLVSCHAKDITLHHKAALHFDEVMIGKGVLDYRTYLTELARMEREVPLMLEHLEDAEYATARDAIYAVADEMWIDIRHRPALMPDIRTTPLPCGRARARAGAGHLDDGRGPAPAPGRGACAPSSASISA